MPAYIIKGDGYACAGDILTASDDDLIQMTLREAKRDLSRETIEISLDPRPTHNPLDKITPVTDQTLARPPNPNTQTLWKQRQRTDPSTGMLATAGGLVFYGSRDRPFYAVNQLTGETLWSARLNGVPSGGPISFAAGDAAFPVKPMGTGADRAVAPCLATIELGNQLQQAVIERIEPALT